VLQRPDRHTALYALHNSDELRDSVEEHDAEAVIPSKRNRRVTIPHDRQADKTRYEIEHMFCRIKDFTRITRRKCKTSRSFAGFVSLASALLNLQA
jgi:transposase